MDGVRSMDGVYNRKLKYLSILIIEVINEIDSG